ncbi:MAG: lipid A export permease/ATP-binding protein MsbA [Luminiphilus sp.]|jgi:subfamily B ATP-binding cassette protein MsbA|nr:lipid A export permease/ATP-binding protein MsbA [Luminiphilus sp.]MDG1459881.1 lipid A export permease/ATP-binding protein MsbA [Luminiphilus sp.]
MADPTEYQGSDWGLYRRLLSYVVPYSAAFFISVAGFLVYSLGSVLLADLTQFLLDSLGQSSQVELGLVSAAAHWFWPPGDKTPLDYARVAVPVAAVVLSLGRALGFFVGNYYMNVVARSVVHTLRVELFEVMMAAPRRYYDANTSGNLLSKITFNVEQVSGAASDALKAILREGLTVMALVTYMLYLNWRLTLIFFAVAPAIGLVVVVVGRHFRRYSRRIQDSMGSVTQVSSESLGAFEALRVFAATRQQVAKFTNASLFNRNQSLKLAFVQAVSTPVIQTLLAFALGALFWFALDPTILAGFSAGSLVAFITAAAQMGKPIRTLSGVQSIIQRGLAAAEDVFAQIDVPPEPDRGTTPVARAKGEIVMERVSFRYPETNEYALENISLQLKPGETVALVGRSGSGKSTLVQLLLRFYTPDHGEIRLDDLVIEEYALADYRSQFGVVSQNISLFSDTIINNIAFGQRADASYESVLAAARQAHAIEFIEALPDGLDTTLGDGGAGLSGGQKQRLAIARALLKDAPILVLDEATSALDTESETYIQEALAEFCKDRTTLVIAHRLSTIENADRVVVLDQGCVVASGPHKQLLNDSPLYARLHKHEISQS